MRWDHDTYQALGRIVEKLVSARAETRGTGYEYYHALRRDFMMCGEVRLFEECIERLDAWRAKNGHRCVRGIVAEIGAEIVRHRKPLEAAAESPAMMPHEAVTAPAPAPELKKGEVADTAKPQGVLTPAVAAPEWKEPEQLSLFG